MNFAGSTKNDPDFGIGGTLQAVRVPSPPSECKQKAPRPAFKHRPARHGRRPAFMTYSAQSESEARRRSARDDAPGQEADHEQRATQMLQVQEPRRTTSWRLKTGAACSLGSCGRWEAERRDEGWQVEMTRRGSESGAVEPRKLGTSNLVSS